MKPLDRWNNTTAARAVLLVGFPVAILVAIVGGAWFGIEHAVKELWDGAGRIWKGPCGQKYN